MTTFFRIELAVALAVEFFIRGQRGYRANRSRGKPKEEMDAVIGRMTPVDGAAFVFGAVYYFAVIALIAWPTLLGFSALPLPGILRWAGVPLQAGGLLLTHFGLRALGACFSKGSIPAGARLVTSGPYSRVRHPLYLAMFLVSAGASLVTLDALVAASAVGMGVSLVFRARREDRLLAERFGEAWQDYTRTTGRLLPRPGRDPLAKP